jgi:hypothetical protein
MKALRMKLNIVKFYKFSKYVLLFTIYFYSLEDVQGFCG